LHKDNQLAANKDILVEPKVSGKAKVPTATPPTDTPQEQKGIKKVSSSLQTASVRAVANNKMPTKPQAASSAAGPASLIQNQQDTHAEQANDLPLGPSESTFSYKAYKLLQVIYHVHCSHA
jgi:hypothetical protein